MALNLIVETAAFQKWVRKNRLVAAMGRVRSELFANPESGDVVPGAGGLRKMRMAGGGRGKRGGYRVIYVLVVDQQVAALLKGYAKNEMENLDADELRTLVKLLPEIEAMARQQLQPQSKENEDGDQQDRKEAADQEEAEG